MYYNEETLNCKPPPKSNITYIEDKYGNAAPGLGPQSSQTGYFYSTFNFQTEKDSKLAAPQLSIYEINNSDNNSNLGKFGYVDSDLHLHQYPPNMAPRTEAAYISHYDYNNIVHNAKNDVTTYTNTEFKNYEKMCETMCLGDTGCQFYAVSSNACYIGNGTPPGSTSVNTGAWMYKKVLPTVPSSNSCTPISSYNVITTNEWEFYPKSNDMNPYFTCDTSSNNQANTSQRELMNISKNNAKTLTETNNNIKTELNNIMNTDYSLFAAGEGAVDTSAILGAHGVSPMGGRTEGFNTVQSLNVMVSNSKDLKQANQYRTIFWVFIAIILIIMVSRLISS
jgi:hypothetical protein